MLGSSSRRLPFLRAPDGALLRLVLCLAVAGCSLDRTAIGSRQQGVPSGGDGPVGPVGSTSGDAQGTDASVLAADASGGAGSQDAASLASGAASGSAQTTDASVGVSDPATAAGPGKGNPGDMLSGAPPSGLGKCQKWLEIVVRDFTPAHPDFEKFNIAAQGLVKDQLGADRKPVYANAGATLATTSPEAFSQWYNDVPGVNLRLSTRIVFVEQSPGRHVFDSTAFFPIDGMGFGNGPAGGFNVPVVGTVAANAPDHNFLFTTEAHLRFVYRGGETLTFRGDDDMWLFVNGRLTIDLGGPHVALSATVALDALAGRLGLQKGETYPMDIFHAERHTDQSNYRLDTTLDLSCIENVFDLRARAQGRASTGAP